MQKRKTKNNKLEIKGIGITKEKMTGRGGLALTSRYIEKTKFYSVAEEILGKIPGRNKGLTLEQFLKQMIMFFMDGTYMSISSFDKRKQEDGYAGVLESKKEELASSHQIKRFFRRLLIKRNTNNVYRKILHSLFIWRLKIEKPEVIILGIDTMVMDNDESKKREGVEPTYKKKKGYQPLHISWGSLLVDVIFRSGSKHSNHGNDYIKSVERITKLIRKQYKTDVPIIIVGDSGFMDGKAFTYFEEELKIGYIVTGKYYNDILEYLAKIDRAQYQQYEGNPAAAGWSYLEFGNQLKSWVKFRRCIFTRLNKDEDDQYILEFARPDNIIYTNIGETTEIGNSLKEAGKKELLMAESIIRLSHQRGKDELIHRSLKELATKEQLPFKKMGMNRAYYYLLVFSHFLFETYKRDVADEVIPISVYPNTFRRQLIDFAAKIVSHSGEIILKVTEQTKESIKILELWKRCQSPPEIAIII